jgi:hypothetical protein
MISIPIPLGELYDRISILEIKSVLISDKDKLSYVNDELQMLLGIRDEYLTATGIHVPEMLVQQLKSVNLSLWNIEDDLRKKEVAQDFGDDFIALARSVYCTNDLRYDTKSQITALDLLSHLPEQKSYA